VHVHGYSKGGGEGGGENRTASSYKNVKIHAREEEMAMTKDAAVCLAVRRAHLSVY
jgi:hypothetical protein